MSNTLGGDILTATMCTMADMQEIEVADEYTKGFLGTEIGVALGENGLNFLTSGLYERFAMFEEIGNGVYTFKNLYVAITTPLRVVDGVYGWVTNVPELYGDLKDKDLDEFITDSFDSIFKPSNPYNPMPNLSWDILHNHNEDMPSLDGIMDGDPKYV